MKNTEWGCSRNRGLRRILCPKRKEVIGTWRQLCSEDLHDLHSSVNNIGMTKSRKMSRQGMWLLHMGEICIMHAGFWLEKLKVKDHIQDKGTNAAWTLESFSWQAEPALIPSTDTSDCVNKEAHVILFSNLMHYFFIKSVVFLYMFWAILCSSSGGLNCIYTASGSWFRNSS